VWAEGDRSYPVLRADGPVAVAQQVKLAREGYAVSTWSVAARKKDRSHVELSVSASTSGSMDIDILSPDLPLDSTWPLGFDGNGNFYVAMRLYEPDWTGTESWYFVGITPDGTSRGHVRLPLDDWAGGGWELNEDGRVYELHSSQSGIELLKHEFGVR